MTESAARIHVMLPGVCCPGMLRLFLLLGCRLTERLLIMRPLTERQRLLRILRLRILLLRILRLLWIHRLLLRVLRWCRPEGRPKPRQASWGAARAAAA